MRAASVRGERKAGPGEGEGSGSQEGALTPEWSQTGMQEAPSVRSKETPI